MTARILLRDQEGAKLAVCDFTAGQAELLILVTEGDDDAAVLLSPSQAEELKQFLEGWIAKVKK